jgi:hypothetical protein
VLLSRLWPGVADGLELIVQHVVQAVAFFGDQVIGAAVRIDRNVVNLPAFPAMTPCFGYDFCGKDWHTLSMARWR